jgi:hypothetical protein
LVATASVAIVAIFYAYFSVPLPLSTPPSSPTSVSVMGKPTTLGIVQRTAFIDRETRQALHQAKIEMGDLLLTTVSVNNDEWNG